MSTSRPLRAAWVATPMAPSWPTDGCPSPWRSSLTRWRRPSSWAPACALCWWTASSTPTAAPPPSRRWAPAWPPPPLISAPCWSAGSIPTPPPSPSSSASRWAPTSLWRSPSCVLRVWCTPRSPRPTALLRRPGSSMSSPAPLPLPRPPTTPMSTFSAPPPRPSPAWWAA